MVERSKLISSLGNANSRHQTLYTYMFRVGSAHCHQTLFLLAFFFCPFSTQLYFTFLTPPFSLMLILVMLFPLCLHAHERTTRTRFDWYYRTPNNLSTGLPTSQNSPVVVPPHPDPALEPPLPPPNTPTTQSSRLPGHGAQVGVHPSCERSW